MEEATSATTNTSLFDKILDTGLSVADKYFASESEASAAQAQNTLLQTQMQANAQTTQNMLKVGIGVVGALILLGGFVLIFKK